MWVKLGDTRVEEPRFTALPRSARLFYMELLSWSNKTGADGLIPLGLWRRVSDEPDPEEAMSALLDAQAITVVLGVGYQLEWWLEDQMPSEQVEVARSRGRERAKRSYWHRQGDHQFCSHPSNEGQPRASAKARSASGEGKAQRTRPSSEGGQPSTPPSRPDPSSPNGEGEGGRRGGASAATPDGAPAPPRTIEEQLADKRAELARLRDQIADPTFAEPAKVLARKGLERTEKSIAELERQLSKEEQA
jgi:hypothetical protein